ncbi:MAG TPA: MFS transporter [Stellaceae bacterium]|nr:MFS transporter [Stellaceae bacterium]
MATYIDVSDVIERQTKNRFQIMLMFWISITMLIEGFDNQLQAYTAPKIIQEWHLSKQAFGAVPGFFQVGFMIGAVLLGHLGDKVGRRIMIIIGCLMFGVFTVAGGYTHNLTELVVTRALSAVFLGGAVPNAIALAVEYAPLRHRAIRVAIMYVCYTLGAAIGGFIAAKLVPAEGWPSIYYLCGWLAIALTAILYLALPESARFMVVRNRSREMLAATLRRLSPEMAIPADAVFTAKTEKKEKSSVVQLFQHGRAAKTIPLWVACFFSMIALQFIANWMPVIFTDSGLAYSYSVIAIGIFQTAGSVGTLTSGWLLDRKNGILFLGIIALAGASVVIGFQAGMSDAMFLLVLVAMAGFCVIGTQSSLNALSGVLYPTAMRSTGSGWAYGVGRIGAILGPSLGGFLVAAKLPLSEIFMIIAVPPIFVGAAILTLHKLRPNAVRDEAEHPVGATVTAGSAGTEASV